MKKRILKKIISKILLITFTASSFFPYGIMDISHAQISTWDFSIPGDYTVSDGVKVEIASGLGRLKYVMSHQGSIVNGGSVLLNGAYGVAIDGNYAYISAYISDAVEIVDITDPTNPIHVSSISNGGSTLLNGPMDIIKDGNYLYVASNMSNAVEIINVSNPASPVHVASITDGGTRYLRRVSGLYKSGNYLYATANSDDALEIINVTNPASPSHAGSIRNTSNLNGAQDVFVSGNYAYVTSNLDDSLQVINVSNPASPSLAAEIVNGAGGALLNGAYGIEINGNYAYVTSNMNNALEIVDITNPLSPIHYSSISDGGTTLLGGPMGITIDSNLTLIDSNSSDAVEVIDVTTPSTPTHYSSISDGGTTLLNGASDIKKAGNLLYVASDLSDALEIIKAEYPTDSPTIEPVLSQTYNGDIVGFTETLGVGNEGTITYQLSKDGGTTWYYFNGSSWVTTTGGVNQSSNITQINANITSLNSLPGNDFKWKAYLTSNGSQKVELDLFEIETRTAIELANQVFHFDGYDINGNGIYTDEPAHGTNISSWVDKFNGYNANQATTINQPFYTKDALNSFSGVLFQGDDDYFDISNQALINTSSYDEKSFAIALKTGNDITTFQNIYEQGGGIRGYAIQIENGKLYAGVWNTAERTAGDQFKLLSMNIQKDTEYTIIMIQNSTDPILANRTLEIIVNGNSIGTLNNVDVQAAHTGGIGFGYSNGAIKLSDSSTIGNGFYFNGKIGELLCWNHALTSTEIDGINTYLEDKWILDGPEITYVVPPDNGTIATGDFDINILYDDNDYGNSIDITSDVIELYRWNGSSWGTDISGTYINTAGKTMDNFEVTYPVNSIIDGKYKLVFSISDTSGKTGTKEQLFSVGEITPNNIANIIFHYDAQDTDGDYILNNEGNNDGDPIGTLTDKINGYNATQGTAGQIPTFESNSIYSYGSISFTGSQIYGINNQGIINTNANFPEKSFASVFKTGPDVNTFQTIYEQGGAVRGYSFIIHNGHVWAGVWNVTEWDTGHQYKSVDMGPALPNTVYFAMIVQDSQSTLYGENTLKIYLNGNLASMQDHVEQQYNHPGGIAMGGIINDTVRASDNLPINITEGYYFNGNIGELISWNHSLDQAEINGLQEYFSNKWGIVIFTEKDPIPTPTTDRTPTYTFETNTPGTLTYGGSCNSVTTEAFLGINYLDFDSDGAGGPLPDGDYNDCTITLRDGNGFDHVLNVTPFTVTTPIYNLTEVTPVPTPSTNNFPQYTFNSPIAGTIEYFGVCTSDDIIAIAGDNTITFNYLSSGTYPNCDIWVTDGINTTSVLTVNEFTILNNPPTFVSKTLIDNALYPIGTLNFEYNYSQSAPQTINTLSEKVELFKYDSGTGSYGPNIASSYISNLSVNQTNATYEAAGIPYGKYKVGFTINNSEGDPLYEETIIYIDEPEFLISSGSINMGNLSTTSNTYSPEIIVTVKTLGAGFDLTLNKTSLMQNINLDEIVDWDGSQGVGYDKDPYSSSINTISTDELLFTEPANLNTSGDKNTYTYKLKIGSFITSEQQTGDYQTHLSFGINLDY